MHKSINNLWVRQTDRTDIGWDKQSDRQTDRERVLITQGPDSAKERCACEWRHLIKQINKNTQ